ncbi:MAG: GTP-binding protein [endosymbiont of Galathealinum brachiosum]|uniref:GTP-binding protein n=1 Tax=endosymbiont of Galathealinum brachiosum TaxID=2200906 RepID=A0A370DKX6_9GAMM|nr:MAG: GTP-binding protein [endosymbiont of Galathealinum brachiosum]
MLGEKHDLIHELPEYKDQIRTLKMSNKHFEKLFDKYHDLDHQIRRIEEGIETPEDSYSEELKKERLQLKDELFGMIKTA